MQYTQITLAIEKIVFNEIIIAELNELQYEGFEELETGLKAYILSENYDEKALKNLFERYESSTKIDLTATEIMPDQNWNKVWESNFAPVKVGNKVVVKAAFHTIEEEFEHHILISPEMAFGTGHHETTYLMLQQMTDNQEGKKIDFANKRVFDFGCGTGILAIMAALLKAESILAIDYDEWSYKNTVKNAALNHIENIEIVHGDERQIPENTKFDIILANINQTVILKTFHTLYESLEKDAVLLISGILKKDASSIINKAKSHNLKHIDSLYKNEWSLFFFRK